ncbi:class I SAM-dependent methyltransferase [Candidatus Woesebacteria bacterium]|nr:class I SAM-dependent methyltransferase [Candidatus Woesebacteria bacterium]
MITSLVPTTVSLLQKELADCETVLDLGCGADSPIQYVRGINQSVGVDAFEPYLQASRKKHIHTTYKKGNIEDMVFQPQSFDAVILIDVIEHLDKKTGERILKQAETWAQKKVIMVTPNGFIAQSGYDNNRLQEHRSGWDYQELSKLGYECYGLAGLKSLRKPRSEDTKDTDLATSIRFSPKILWFIIASLSQIITYRMPSIAFSLFCVKNLKNQI